ncbi:Odorant receptor [Operophtera brumata]|uniref:Odorant receptor n=1 Tax=Operophtera brumata TaxID=104452 RepID=A0A0L7L1C3_OPEBR|nr:Odorant receptor [Operophtera brumata]
MGDEILLFDQTIKKFEIILHVGGFNINSGEKTSSDYIKSRIIYIINFFWLNVDLVGGIYWFIDRVSTGEDFLGLTYIAPCICLSTLATVKGLLLVLNEKHAHKLMENLRNLEKIEKERQQSQEKDDIIKKERDFLNIVINMVTWLYVIVDVTFAVGPIVIIMVKYYNAGEVELILPFLVVYPFDPFKVTMVNDVAFIITFLSFLFSSLFQVFFLCYFADLLMTASMEITDAVYKSQWYIAEASVGKKLLIMQTRGQVPCKLTAFGFADVNLNSFMREDGVFRPHAKMHRIAKLSSAHNAQEITEGKNFLELTSIAPCITFTILSMFKSLLHLINETEISKLIDNMRKLERDENNRQATIEKDKIITEERQFLNRVLNVLYILSYSMIVVFDMTPLVLMALKFYKTNEFEMLLPYLDVFSFIPYDFKYWLFAYVHQIWSECIVLLEIGAADYLFFTCCTYLRTQFRLLQHDIERMIPNTSHVMLDEDFQAKFTELVQWHQEIIKSSNTLETIYSKSNLFNFMSSSLVICLTGFNVTVTFYISESVYLRALR